MLGMRFQRLTGTTDDGRRCDGHVKVSDAGPPMDAVVRTDGTGNRGVSDPRGREEGPGRGVAHAPIADTIAAIRTAQDAARSVDLRGSAAR